jgi:hypothetical protein
VALITGLEFDDFNIAEIAAHGVRRQEVVEVFESGYRLIRNAKRHKNQPYVMIGRTLGGRWLSIPIGPTDQEGIWRPATAFRSPQVHITKAGGGE